MLFLWNRGQDTKVGEVVVYNVRGKDIPIVHRVVRRFGGGSGYVVSNLVIPIKVRKREMLTRRTTVPKHLPSNS